MDKSNAIIDALGGTQQVADLCGIGKSAVSQWRKRGIPHSWQKYLKQISPAAFRQKKRKAIS